MVKSATKKQVKLNKYGQNKKVSTKKKYLLDLTVECNQYSVQNTKNRGTFSATYQLVTSVSFRRKTAQKSEDERLRPEFLTPGVNASHTLKATSRFAALRAAALL